MHWQECPEEILKEYSESSGIPYEFDDDPDEKEVEWREDASSWTIPEFFEVLKDQFKKLNWIPISPRTVLRSGSLGRGGEDIVASRLRDIYRQHAWPDVDVYRKSECLEVVDRALAECYPDYVCCRRRDNLTPDPDPSVLGVESKTTTR